MRKDLYLKDLQKWNYAKEILEKHNVEIIDPTQPHWSGNGNGARLILTPKKTKESIFISRKEDFEDIKNKLEKILENKGVKIDYGK